MNGGLVQATGWTTVVFFLCLRMLPEKTARKGYMLRAGIVIEGCIKPYLTRVSLEKRI